MRLYHGTNLDFQEIDIAKSNPYKDFGKGFYLTDLLHQAERMALRKVKFFGGECVVQEYEFDESLLESNKLNVKVFPSPNEEWAAFIHNNRNNTGEYHHDYDIVIGPIADDGVAFLLGRYEEGTITLTELARQLEYRQLNNQYFFGTVRAINLLRRV
jgi:hypothetical protein